MAKSANKSATTSSARQRARLAAMSNLVKSGQLEKYYKLLTDFDFMAAKINHPEFGVQALITDYDLVDDSEVLAHPEYNPEKVNALKLIQEALRLSAHVLAKDKTQLAAQLLGRLLPLSTVASRQYRSECQPEYRYFWEYIPFLGRFLPKYSQKDLTVEAGHTAQPQNINQPLLIQELLEQVKQWKDRPWLRPLQPSLTPPGGRLIRTLSGHSSYVNAVVVTSDGKQVISGSSDKTLKLWNLETGEELFTLKGHSASINAVVLTPDGKRVISGSEDGSLKLWDLETREELFTLKAHRYPVRTVAVTSDSKRVLSGSEGATLKLWDLETREELFTFKGHSSYVNAVAVTPDGKQAISGSPDSNLKLWDLETREELFTLNDGHYVNAVAVTTTQSKSGIWKQERNFSP